MTGYAEGSAPLAGAFSSMRLERFRAAQASALPERPHTWVILGDLHGRVRRVREIPELEKADGIILTGDLTTLGGTAAARHVIEAIEAVTPSVFAQIGNMDRPEVNDWLEARGINLHRKVRKLLPNVALLGVGGSTFSPFGTPSEFPEARFSEWLEELALRAGSTQHMVLAAHNPPYNTACDRTSNGLHVGSSAVRDFIEEPQPAICLCGHIHESVGMERLGRTVVANPGPFSAGCYALLTASPSGVHVTLKRLVC